jgi:hypothetical protein
MPRRRALTGVQIEALLALPTTEPDLIRHYTLNSADLAVIARRRRPHNRLGFAVQLCALRFPGRLLRPGAAVPCEVLSFVADQLDLDPGHAGRLCRPIADPVRPARIPVRRLWLPHLHAAGPGRDG